MNTWSFMPVMGGCAPSVTWKILLRIVSTHHILYFAVALSIIIYYLVSICQTAVLTGHNCEGFQFKVYCHHSKDVIATQMLLVSAPPEVTPISFVHNPEEWWLDFSSQQRRQSDIYTTAWAPLVQSVSLDPECRIHSLPTSQVWQRIFFFLLKKNPSQCMDQRGLLKLKKSHCSEALIHSSCCLPPLLWLYHRELDGGKGKQEQPSMASWWFFFASTCSQKSKRILQNKHKMNSFLVTMRELVIAFASCS